MNKKMAREIVESLPSLYPSMTTDEEEAIWTVLATNSNTENNDDCISRAEAIDAVHKEFDECLVWDESGQRTADEVENILDGLPSAQQEQLGTNLEEVGTDCISRQQAIDKFIDGLEEIFADLRERHIDDSVCGLCEYDGAYIGQSGDWCNECPGFDKDDCFKLRDKTRKEWTEEIIKALPPAQPEIIRCKDCKHHWTHKCMDSMPIERCDLEQTFYDAEHDFCSLAERRADG